MNRLQKLGVVGLCLALVVTTAVPPLLRGAAPASAAHTPPAKRTMADIEADFKKTEPDVTKYLPSLTSLADPDFRKGDGQKALPALKKMISLLQEVQDVSPTPEEREAARGGMYLYMMIAGALGDKDVQAAMAETAKGKDAVAVQARAAIAIDQWIETNGKADAQVKLLDDLAPLAKDNPEDSEVLDAFAVMTRLNPGSNDVTKKIMDIIRTNMKGADAKSLLAQLDGQQEQLAMVGKPLVITGRTSTGSTFTSADYKGKVVMLDFWATWCGPCIGELPNVKKAYADYHAKGFEIVGLSCDTGDEVLNTFIAKNEMPWIQLRETSQDDGDRWHPIAKKFHVDGIPAMFLIDKKGNLRFVDAREDLAKKIAQLLDEKDDAAPAPATK